MNAAWENVLRGRTITLLLPFGFGDGGSGPPRRCSSCRPRRRFPRRAGLRQDVEEAFCDGVIADADLPTWVGGSTRDAPRRTPPERHQTGQPQERLALRDAEICGVWAGLLGASPDGAPPRGRGDAPPPPVPRHLPARPSGRCTPAAGAAPASRTATSDDALSAVVAEAGGADLVAVNTLSGRGRATIPAPAGEMEIVSADERGDTSALRDGGARGSPFPPGARLGVAGFRAPGGAPASTPSRRPTASNSMFRLEIARRGHHPASGQARREVVPPGRSPATCNSSGWRTGGGLERPRHDGQAPLRLG